MKKLIAIILAAMVLCSCILSGCGTKPESHITEYCETVYEGFKEKKTEEIIALFCDKSSSDHNMEEELSQAFDYINGNIMSYERFEEGVSGKSYRKGKLVKYDQTAAISGVSTDTGHIYRIAINSLNVYPDAPELVGVQRIYIREFDTEDKYKELSSFTVGDQYELSVKY